MNTTRAKRTKSAPALTTVAEHLRHIPADTRAMAQALRRLVKAANAKTREVSYQKASPAPSRAMWKIARYEIAETPIVGIGVFPKYATLFFFAGAALDDGTVELHGSGKQFRFVRVESAEAAGAPALKRLVKRAFAQSRARAE